MKNRVITISREFGSGGRTIGKKVAEKLGIPCYDAEIIQEMAKETGFAPDYVKVAGEYAPGSFLSSAFSNRMFGPTNEDLLWKLQYRIIRELAEKEPCVIVGRCADYILKDYENVVNIFIRANLDFRIKRSIQVDQLDESKAGEIVSKKDKSRGNYYRYHAGERWDNLMNYDLVLRSDLVGIDKAVECIKNYVEAM